MKTFSTYIKKYLENRPFFYSYIRPQEASLFYERISKMKGPILDFGCGDGFFANAIFKKKYINVGLDISSSRMEEARKLNIYKSIKTYDGNTIPFKNNHFNTIISNCVFEHIPQINESVKEMHRVLKTGGLLMTTVMCSSWNANLLGGKILGKKYVDWFNKIQHHDSLLSKKEWAHLFKISGYEIVESIDYLFEKAAQKTEIYHYLSFPSLLSYKLFKKWQLFPIISQKKIYEIEELIKKDTKKPSACFFVLKKLEIINHKINDRK